MRPDDHGGDLAAHPGIHLDFSVNLNPLGIPRGVKAAIAATLDTAADYPDPQCRALRRALAAYHQVAAELIVCGNGASDLIYRICETLRPRRILTVAPTFSEYERSARLQGALVSRHRLDAHEFFDVGPDFLDSLVPGVDLVFCCQPNNPTGRLIDPPLLARIVERAGEIGAVIVVDECFLPFTDAPSLIPATGHQPHLIVLRALTKTYALAGLRLGYAVTGDPTLTAALAAHGSRWNVSTIAQTAGLAALSTPGWTAATRLVVERERSWVSAQLVSLGLDVIPSHANFLLFRCLVDLFPPLTERGLLIRPCGNFAQLDGTYWRIGLKGRPDNEALVEALTEAVEGPLTDVVGRPLAAPKKAPRG
jgi:threonine-phosphate decarboxylase